ncbi:recombinase [Chryseobacterium formosense]|uniref:Recombinase n=1 Tax=Chryseobacterium formosense TaxID=236814 RepID=A0A085ZA26_9FLAO|nr:site-specific integrase [Chryseobacterium formosense]KFF01290.1 recombinase [Chryseobacterium formosense]SFT45167.1 Site-specific recombinase XerD [Chryseobacterium formosense]
MNKTFNLLFFIKKNKIRTNGTAPIYLRITVDGKAAEIAAKRYIDPKKWDNKSQKAIGYSQESKTLNSYLKTLEQQVYDFHYLMLKEEDFVTAESLKSKLLGTDVSTRMLIPIFQDHNDKVEALIGQDFAPGTLERYKTSLKHTQEFLNWKYKISDIDITKIDHAFIMDYDFWLRSVRKCANNTAVKYIKNFKKIMRLCMANGWLSKDPFLGYKAKIKEVERPYLTKKEIQSVYDKEFASDRLNQVRDIFLFSCYTGLAYVDVVKLSKSHINIGIDGDKWIFTNRQKTGTATRVPLLPLAQELILKYEDHPECVNLNVLFPVLSNQKMNSYLKEIANVCGINKELTFHIARHTFATTVTLSNGVPIESVSKMLGHKNIKTTQHYAKILDKKVSDDMLLVREIFKNKE